MHYIKPDYYDKFKCTASECSDTCCSGWNIQIDEETLHQYEQQEGVFGEKLRDAVDWEAGCFRQKGHYCMLLDKNHLCSVCLELGADAMCDTCRTYPRHIEEYKNVREYSLSMSCPEAARLILTADKRKFIYEDDDLLDDEEDFEDYNEKMYNQLTECRYTLLQYIDHCNFGLDYTISTVMYMAREMQTTHDNGSMQIPGILYTVSETKEYTKLYAYDRLKGEFAVFYELDIQRNDWLQILHDTWHNLFEVDAETYRKWQNDFRLYLVKEADFDWRNAFCNIFFYFIYIYLDGAVYDDRIYSKAVFSIFSVMWIKTFFLARWIVNGGSVTLDDLIEITYRYAREVEHSDYNLEVLEDFCEQIR